MTRREQDLERLAVLEVELIQAQKDILTASVGYDTIFAIRICQSIEVEIMLIETAEYSE